MSIKVKCNKCGKTLLTYDNGHFRRYKSPVKHCKKCGTVYADPRCHEIMVEGIPSDTFSYLSYFIMLIIGALIFYRGLVIFNSYQLGVPNQMQWLLPSVFIIIGLIMVIGGIWELISIKTGLKKKKFKKLALQSHERLKNKEYAYTLKQLGYKVPDKYL